MMKRLAMKKRVPPMKKKVQPMKKKSQAMKKKSQGMKRRKKRRKKKRRTKKQPLEKVRTYFVICRLNPVNKVPLCNLFKFQSS